MYRTYHEGIQQVAFILAEIKTQTQNVHEAQNPVN
jgi:hypothetical protein